MGSENHYGSDEPRKKGPSARLLRLEKGLMDVGCLADDFANKQEGRIGNEFMEISNFARDILQTSIKDNKMNPQLTKRSESEPVEEIKPMDDVITKMAYLDNRAQESWGMVCDLISGYIGDVYEKENSAPSPSRLGKIGQVLDYIDSIEKYLLEIDRLIRILN